MAKRYSFGVVLGILTTLLVGCGSTGGGGAGLASSSNSPPPTITQVIPDSGPLIGGTEIRIIGEYLSGEPSVTVGGVAAIGVTPNEDGTQIICVTPAGGAPGPGTIRVVTDHGSTSLTDGYMYNLIPTIQNFSPNSGPIIGGTPLTINGTGFAGTIRVLVGGVDATQVVVDDFQRRITCRTPAQVTATPAEIKIMSSVTGDISSSAPFVYNTVISISSVSPPTGPKSGGTQVTVTGTGFLGFVSVRIGDTTVPITSIEPDGSRLTCFSPIASSDGSVDVAVTSDLHGTSILPDGFSYVPDLAITSLNPTSGLLDGGTFLEISASGLSGNVSVSIGGKPATNVQVTSPGTLTCRVPAGDSAGLVDVIVTSSVHGSVTVPDAFTYLAKPLITTVSPNNGPKVGNTGIKIFGANFLGTLTVTIDGGLVTGLSVNTDRTEITFTTRPSFFAGAVDLAVASTERGTTIVPGGFTYNPELDISRVTPTNGPLAGGNQIAITGTNLNDPLTVSIGGTAATDVSVNPSKTEILCTVPPGPTTGTVDVTVSSPSHGDDIIRNSYTYDPDLDLTAVTPNFGPLAGGTNITLTGISFFDITGVTIGGLDATNVTVLSSTSITCKSPASTVSGPVDVMVSSLIYGSDTLPGGFIYGLPPAISAITPSTGSIDGATPIQIEGTGYEGTVGVTLGGTPATSVVVSPDGTLISCETPSAGSPGQVDVIVTSSVNGAVTRENGFTYSKLSMNSRLLLTAGRDPAAITLEDLDSDGWLDIAVANSNDSSISVFKSDQAGGFLAGSTFLVGDAPRDIVAAHLLLNSPPSLVVSNSVSDTVSFLEGDGNGGFTPFSTPATATGTGPRRMAHADFTGDGFDEIVVVNEFGDDVTTLESDGTEITSAPAVDVETGPVALAVAEFGPRIIEQNFISRTGLVVGNNGSATMTFLSLNLAHRFVDPITIAGGHVLDLRLADMDRSGTLDIVSVNETPDAIILHRGTRAPSFEGAESTSVTGGPNALEIADMDGDGALDVVTSHPVSQDLKIFPGKGTGSLGDPVSFFIGTETSDVASGDLDRDGRPDVVVCGFGTENNVTVLFNTTAFAGTGTFGSGTASATDALPLDAVTGDFDRNGTVDVATANFERDTVSILLGAGNGTFSVPVNISVNDGPTAIGVGDFFEDGTLDLVVINAEGPTSSLYILRGQGNGSFLPGGQIQIGTNGNARDLVVADFDRDGTLDLAVAKVDVDVVSIYLGNGSGGFSLLTDLTVGDGPRCLVSADFNLDGSPDLAIANSLSGTSVSVLLGNGDATFQTAASVSLMADPQTLAVGDVNRDGGLDLIVSTPGTDGVFTLLGRGDGTFLTPSAVTVGGVPLAVFLADANRDGALDLITTLDPSSSSISIANGTGDGDFSSPQQISVTNLTGTIVVRDFNRDGLPDLGATVSSGSVGTPGSLLIFLQESIDP